MGGASNTPKSLTWTTSISWWPPLVFTSTEAARVQPAHPSRAAHDALDRIEPDPTALWQAAEQHIDRHAGILIVDDTTLDTPYATNVELVHCHWSGEHHRVVRGINC